MLAYLAAIVPPCRVEGVVVASNVCRPVLVYWRLVYMAHCCMKPDWAIADTEFMSMPSLRVTLI